MITTPWKQRGREWLFLLTINPYADDISLLRSMKEAGNIPAHGYYDQLVELKSDLDSFKGKCKQPESIPLTTNTKDTSGLDMLLAASGTFNNDYVAPLSGGYNTPKEATVFGVGDAMGALDDPFLQDFLQQPYTNWPSDDFGGPGAVVPSEQLQFDWENANLFGNT